MTKENFKYSINFKTNIIFGNKSCTYREHENLVLEKNNYDRTPCYVEEQHMKRTFSKQKKKSLYQS